VIDFRNHINKKWRTA